MTKLLRLLALALALSGLSGNAAAATVSRYEDLVALFHEWRAFEQPATVRSVPDYGAAAMARKAAELPTWQRRLEAIDTGGWTAEQKIDWQLVRAEMNGLDFDLRVLRPYARDPAFYVTIWASQTDVPSRDGPAAFPATELYELAYPLSAADQRMLTERLAAVRPLLAQARVNLADSNARDLWRYGIRSLQRQARTLERLGQGSLTVSSLEGDKPASIAGAGAGLKRAIEDARTATNDFIGWLEQETPKKTGPSGIGKDNYSWYLKNVHLLPYGWEEEAVLLRRELERAHASLRLEEQRNRNLPPLQPADSAEAYDRLSRERLDKFVDFLVKGEVIPDKPYIRAALAEQLGSYIPPDRREFFNQMTHREPMTLLSHDYHWLDLARARDEPHASPIRRLPSLYNIWDSRAEGFATAFEEMLMHAGLYDDNPRARELVWIMLANRAARGLASLYVHSNESTLEEAGRFHARWTPRHWVRADDDLTAFEQFLYLRQPGYGTSYVSGKLLFDRLIANSSHELEEAGKPFVLKDFLSRMNDAGMIPVTLLEQEMVGR